MCELPAFQLFVLILGINIDSVTDKLICDYPYDSNLLTYTYITSYRISGIFFF